MKNEKNYGTPEYDYCSYCSDGCSMCQPDNYDGDDMWLSPESTQKINDDYRIECAKDRQKQEANGVRLCQN